MNENKLLYSPDDDEYFIIHDFVGLLENSPENAIDDFYVVARIQKEWLEYLNNMEEKGIVKKFDVDENGNPLELDMVENLMVDSETLNIIQGLQNTIDEYHDFFEGDNERLSRLNKTVDEVWEEMKKNNPITNTDIYYDEGGDDD